MKVKHLKKAKHKGKTVYICPNCGSIMEHEDNQEAGEPSTDDWYECYSCGAKAI